MGRPGARAHAAVGTAQDTTDRLDPAERRRPPRLRKPQLALALRRGTGLVPDLVAALRARQPQAHQLRGLGEGAPG